MQSRDVLVHRRHCQGEQRLQLVELCFGTVLALDPARALGAALASRLVDLGWIARRRDSRAIAVTLTGKRRLLARLGVPL